jgi:peptide/nickel transport system permease protein
VVDDVVMRIMDGLLAFPILVLALAIVAVLGPDLRAWGLALGARGSEASRRSRR